MLGQRKLLKVIRFVEGELKSRGFAAYYFENNFLGVDRIEIVKSSAIQIGDQFNVATRGY